MSSPLTRQASAKVGYVAFQTLLLHYYRRVKKEGQNDGGVIPQLRQDELLYDEAYNIIKRFLEISTDHPVEDVQALLNTRMPSPPWVHVVRLLIPMPCCDEAAILLTRALGGEEHAKRVVGGTKWWQARNTPGIEAEWIAAKKDWQEAEKHRRASQSRHGSASLPSRTNSAESTHLHGSKQNDGNAYDQHMDEQRCILYAHGGGYYVGSIDHERYIIQRFARKINGRVFAVNYRLAPQYPFPCALHDFLAAYLYLIRPPPGASHQPVSPSHIVVAGNSAGGGLTLALLQVIRDSELPLPAGGVLISPWCDLTHSFPSTFTNAATDVIPKHGLTLFKPSVLWPPPPDEITHQMRNALRHGIRQIVHLSSEDDRADNSLTPIDLQSIDATNDETISLRTESGKLLETTEQVQVYTQNSLLIHPLVSPALSYLGGLPPLLFIASDREVLRDEIIYCAHKAAEPSQFPLTAAARNMYPALVGIEKRHHNTTPVHLQVYDDTAHILPVLFGFSTPGKFCHRAIANFVKHVTGLSISTKSSSPGQMLSPSPFVFQSPMQDGPADSPFELLTTMARTANDPNLYVREGTDGPSTPTTPRAPTSSSKPRPSLTPSVLFRIKDLQASLPRSVSFFATTKIRGPRSPPETSVAHVPAGEHRITMPSSPEARFAGEGSVYWDEAGYSSWNGGMIRERISTSGEIRPLEPKEQLAALLVPQSVIGTVSPRVLEHYLEGKASFDEKFAKGMQEIEKQRRSHIDLTNKDFSKVIHRLEELQLRRNSNKEKTLCRADASNGSWGLAWAFDESERPPPSSIVARCDTAEARRLARIANEAILQGNPHFGGNSVRVSIMNFLSICQEEDLPQSNSKAAQQPASPILKSKSVFASLRMRVRSPTPVDGVVLCEQHVS